MKAKDEPVVVFPCPEFSEEEEAKLQLEALAEVMHHRAADALAHGLYFEGQSVRVQVLLESASDGDLVRARDMLIEGGLLEIEGELDLSAITSTGGDA